MHLRNVELTDVEAYVRMRCDPVMMAELGGPLPREGIEAKVRRDVESAAADREWIKVIVPDEAAPHVAAGTVGLWSHWEEWTAPAGAAHADVAGAGSGADAGGDAAAAEPAADGPAGEQITEIGWMVLPEFQGRGLAKRAVREVLRLAREDGRWGRVHAFPGVTNGPSNGICRSLGFTFVEQRDVTFADRLLHTNHWVIDLADLVPADLVPGGDR